MNKKTFSRRISMIYTISLNPAIDYIVELDSLIEGELNKSKRDKKISGGKGIMVSKLLKTIGIESVNIGFIGGHTGNIIIDDLGQKAIGERFTRINGDTRINIKLKTDIETEINSEGPRISQAEKSEFMDLIKTLEKDDFVVISGSIPKSISDLFYSEIIEVLQRKAINFAIDTRGKSLYDSFKYRPLLIKPNRLELEELFDRSIKSLEDIVSYGHKCLELGCENVIVSMGKDGAIFISENERYYGKAIEGKLINSVGAGDSMLAGFIGGLERGYTKRESFKLAVASGTATAFSEDIGSIELIKEMLDRVELVEI